MKKLYNFLNCKAEQKLPEHYFIHELNDKAVFVLENIF